MQEYKTKVVIISPAAYCCLAITLFFHLISKQKDKMILHLTHIIINVYSMENSSFQFAIC